MICDFHPLQQYFRHIRTIGVQIDNERLCAVEPCLPRKRCPPTASLEPGQSLPVTYLAAQAPQTHKNTALHGAQLIMGPGPEVMKKFLLNAQLS